MAEIKIFNPAGLARPAATYSLVAHAKVEDLVFIAGQAPTDASGASHRVLRRCQKEKC